MALSILQGLLAGVQKMRNESARWGYPAWLRPFTGPYEVTATALVIAGFWDPAWAAVGAGRLAVSFVGAVLGLIVLVGRWPS